MSLGPLYVLLGEVSVQVFCPFFNWVLCLSGVEFCESLHILEIKPLSEVSSHTSQNGQHKQIHKQMLERMQRKGNPSALLVGMQTGEATVENSMEFPQKTKNGTAF